MVLLGVESWLLIVCLLFLLRYYVHQKWQFLDRIGVPHNQPSLLKVGNAVDVLSNKLFKNDLESKQKFGKIWGYYTGLIPRIVVHDPGMLQQVFIKEFANFPRRLGRLKKINGKEFGSGLLSIDGKQWKRVRSTMTPTFSASKLRQMAGIIDWCTDNTVNVFIKRNIDGDGTFNASRIFPCLSMDVICSAAFSTRVNYQDDTKEEPEIAAQARKMFDLGFFNILFFLCIMFPSLEPMVANYNSRKSHVVYFKKLTNHIIEQRKKSGFQDRVDLMQLMLDAEVPDTELDKGSAKGMTKLEIIGNSMLMILAGYETTGNTMMFLAYNLAFHPNIQADLQKEIDEMFQKTGKYDYDSTNNLKLLDMCLNESLRLYSPIARTMRIPEREITINGFTFPAGVSVVVPIYALGHDPEFWESPMEYKPERMRDMSQVDPMLFNPFGAGPRNCIWQRFAIMEIKMAFCKFLHHFTFEPTEGTPKPPLTLKFDVTVGPIQSFHLRAVPRT